jgi:hypothetical protein
MKMMGKLEAQVENLLEELAVVKMDRDAYSEKYFIIARLMELSCAERVKIAEKLCEGTSEKVTHR